MQLYSNQVEKAFSSSQRERQVQNNNYKKLAGFKIFWKIDQIDCRLLA